MILLPFLPLFEPRGIRGALVMKGLIAMTDPNINEPVPTEVDPADEAWALEGDDSLGDAEDPTRNDDEEAGS